MRKSGKSKRIFFKSFYISLTLLICILIAFFGVCSAYENTVRIGFGEYKRAIVIEKDKIRILDFEIDI